MTRRTSSIALSLALLSLLGALAAPPAPAEEEDGLAGPAGNAGLTGPTVVVRPLEGATATGHLRTFDEKTLELTTDAGAHAFPVGEIIDVRVTPSGVATLAKRPHLRVGLTGGESLLGVYAGPVEGGLVLDTPDLGRVAILLDVVRTIASMPADADPCYEPEHKHGAGDEDKIYVLSQDEYAGIVLSVEDEGFEIETRRGKTRRVSWDNLLVLHLQNEIPAAQEGTVIEIETIEGARLVAAGALALDEGALLFSLRSLPEQGVRVPLGRVRAIRPSGGAFVYASDLPFKGRHVPYYDNGIVDWWFEVRADRRPKECPLRIAGRTYRHGFAAHARSFVTLEPKKAYRRFQALVGVDDVALMDEDGGVLDARVLGDGEVLWEAKDVRVGEPPRVVGPLDIAEVQVLELVVDFGAKDATLDRASWVEPIFVR